MYWRETDTWHPHGRSQRHEAAGCKPASCAWLSPHCSLQVVQLYDGPSEAVQGAAEALSALKEG